MDMNNDHTSGQKRSYSCGIRNLDQSLDEIRTFLEIEKETEQKQIDKTICQAEADWATAEAERMKAKQEKEKALSQINALKTVRQTVSNLQLSDNLKTWTTPFLLGLELDTLATGQKREMMLDQTMMVRPQGELPHKASNLEDGLVPDKVEEEEEGEHLTKVKKHPSDLHKMRT